MSQNMTCPANAPTLNSSSIGATRRRMFLFISIIRESTYRKIGGTPYTCRRRHSRHPIRHCYESMSRTTVRDRLPTRHSAGRKHAPYPDTGPESRVGKPVAPELLPSQGSPTPRDFHPLMRPSQGHGDSRHPLRHSRHSLRHSREGGNPGEVYGFANDPQTTPTISTLIFIPWCAGGQPAWAIISESLSRTKIRDEPFDQPSVASSLVPSHKEKM